MAQRIILYTSSSEGITLGVQGETWMECLLALSDEFGEGMLPLYEKTKEEFQQVAEAVAETFAEELDGITKDLTGAAAREVEKGQKEKADAKTARDKVLAALSVPEDDEPPQDSGAEQPSLDTSRQKGGDGDDAVRPAGGSEDAAPVCSICGADTTPDYAKLTKIEHGEIRCPDCTP